eukprot:scaffold71949_cov25-Tisochrysis_lutea.AAC.2
MVMPCVLLLHVGRGATRERQVGKVERPWKDTKAGLRERQAGAAPFSTRHKSHKRKRIQFSSAAPAVLSYACSSSDAMFLVISSTGFTTQHSTSAVTAALQLIQLSTTRCQSCGCGGLAVGAVVQVAWQWVQWVQVAYQWVQVAQSQPRMLTMPFLSICGGADVCAISRG